MEPLNRKKAVYTFAVIDTLVNLLIIALFLMGKLSLTGFTIAFAIALVVGLVAAIVIIRKTE
ncbi:MAG: hypothetical protein IKX56_07665 [Muribaculaceae bacterium]|nr:hypothetical protein [Muribaculaceae bacterium]